MRIVSRPDSLDEAVELALARALVDRALSEAAGWAGELLHVRRPAEPVVVFGRRDTRLPGFADAVGAVRRAGFRPLVRSTGGRAVAYTDQALVLDHVARAERAMQSQEERFEAFGETFAAAFRGLGVDARVGAVPGEYCPGAHSVNARGTVKLVGTSQRVNRRAWLFASLVVVDGHDVLAPLLEQVYGALGQPFDPASVGSLAGEVPGLDVETVRAALLASYGTADPGVIDQPSWALARQRVADHLA